MSIFDDNDGALKKLEWDAVYTFRIGGVPVVFGRTTQDGKSGPVMYGAALSRRELHQEKCGYGASEAEAAADLFRMSRPDLPSFLDF